MDLSCLHIKRIIVFLAAYTMCSANDVYAGEQDKRPALEEIIVTAQRREESLQDTPISVAAFNNEQMRAINMVDPGDISEYTPNVQISKSAGNQSDYQYSIRGIASAESTLTTDPTVGLYLDGVYIARNAGAAFDVADLERIEILRGPQGTLFGRNTTGGAINLITRKPSGEFSFVQDVSAGSRDYLRTRTSIDFPAWNGFAAKFSFNHSERGGLVKSLYTGDEHGGYENDAARLAVRWTLGDDLIIDYAVDWSAREANEQYAQISHVRPLQIALGGPYYQAMAAASGQDRVGKLPYTQGDTDTATSDVLGHALTLEYDLFGQTFKSITAYRRWENRAKATSFGSFPSDGATLLDGFTGTFIPAGELVTNFSASLQSLQGQWSQEFQLLGLLFDDRLHYTVGLYYFQEDGHQDNPQKFVLPASFVINTDNVPAAAIPFLCQGSCFGKSVQLGAPNFFYGIDNEAFAAYGQFTWSVTDRLDATLGLRWTRDRKEAFLISAFTDIGLNRIEDSKTWSNFNPSFTVEYEVNDTAMVYGKVATGYRAGGHNARASTASSFLQPANEENIVSYEVGLKADWWERRIRLNTAVFHYSYDDAQVLQFEAGSGGASAKLVNAGKQKADGFELDLTVLPFGGLMLQLNYGYLDIDIEEFVSSVNDPVTGLPMPPFIADIRDSASTILHSPEHTAAAIAEYTFEPTTLGTFKVRLDATYRTERTFNPALFLFDSADEHTLVNARLTLSDVALPRGSLELAVWGRNLTNEAVRDWGIDFGVLGYAINFYKELRSVGLDLRYEY